eukprot:COSAG01_NODE_59321_length_301_cov_0.460396_1_plen_48_part_01
MRVGRPQICGAAAVGAALVLVLVEEKGGSPEYGQERTAIVRATTGSAN